MDAFSEVLSGVRLKGAVFFNAEFTAPWTLATPNACSMTPTLAPGAQHLVMYHYVVDGQARATTYGLDTPSPSLKGDTGVFEIGFDMKPRTDGPLTVGLGAQAYTGMREGFGGTAKLMWVF